LLSDELVVLVDARDNEMGTASKRRAHLDGRLHRAVSVFVFNGAGEMLLQQRAAGKYHSAGLWSNACCSHPRPGENPHQAAIRRLEEEMGLRHPLEHVFAFIYRAELDSGLTEHELDHVFVGVGDEDPVPNAGEVMDWMWMEVPQLTRELARAPERFTAWFPLALHELLARRNGGEIPRLW
jgi:isopentenyl-diphosphate delta-isomerase